MPHYSLTVELAGRDPDAAEAVCVAAGAVSVSFSDARDDAILEPLPGEFRLWPATRMQALFGTERDAQRAAEGLVRDARFAPGEIAIELVADRAWEREWLKHFGPMRFGRRLWICPSHERVSEPGAVVVRLDPGLAFGTGTHPTTALCLEWLERHVRAGERVIDYGCGSGVLALAAVLLGAARADCFDIDPQALLATRDNAAANGVLARVHLHSAADGLPRGADVLIANILSATLCELAPRLAALVRAGGRIVLSGVLEAQAAEVTRTYAPWFDIGPFGVREGWIGLEGRRGSEIDSACSPSARSAP